MQTGWSRRVLVGKAGKEPDALPKIVTHGTNNGTWFAARHMYVVNENTDKAKDLVDQRPFATWLKDVEPEAKSPAASLLPCDARPGFAVELVAAEPLVIDPVAFDWGPDGRMWVAEMSRLPQRHGRRRQAGWRNQMPGRYRRRRPLRSLRPIS